MIYIPKFRINEIPLETVRMRDAVELMNIYSKEGYETNIKSQKGKIFLQVKRICS